MSKLIKTDKEYAAWIKILSNRFRQSQIKASVRVNSEMLLFYWNLGVDMDSKKADSKYGSGFFKNLSLDLGDALPGIRAFSIRNLQNILKWYRFYKKDFPITKQADSLSLENTKQVVSQSQDKISFDDFLSIPWGHHVYILQKCNSTDKALFFVQQTLKHCWSRSVLLNFLDTNLYEREGKAITNFSATLPSVTSDLAQEITKDPYNFDFVGLTEPYKEKELKDALIKNIEKFLLEMGNGFAYMGREFRMEVDHDEFFADMLFYNTKIHSYVIVEVKTTVFETSFLGQLSGYVSFANHILKGEGDNPTIGLLVCKNKNDIVARYALEGYTQPLGISEYELSKVFPENFKSSLPSIEDIENELKENK